MKGSLVRLSLRHTWCHQTDRLSLLLHAPSVMMQCAPPVVAPSRVLRQKLGNLSQTCFTMKQAIGCRRVPSHRLHSLISFESQTDKPFPTWVWGPNQETVVVILRPKSPNHRPLFWGPNQARVVVVLRSNHWQTVAIGFEAKLENSCFSSPLGVQCVLHTASPDLPIVQPPSTWLVPDHPWSSAPSLLLLPQSSSLSAMSHSPLTHHETSNHVSPNWITQSRVTHHINKPKCIKFKFKLNKVNYSSHK
jgi:hypothetical protein